MKNFLSQFVACPACDHHVKREENACPHCGAALRSKDGAPLKKVAAIALGVSVATLSMVELGACSAYGVPCTAGHCGEGGGGGASASSTAQSSCVASSSSSSSASSSSGGAPDAGGDADGG